MQSLNNTAILLDMYDALLQSPVYDRLEPLARVKEDEDRAREVLTLLPEGTIRNKVDDAIMGVSAAGEANGFVIGFRFALSMIQESQGLFSAVAAVVCYNEKRQAAEHHEGRCSHA